MCNKIDGKYMDNNAKMIAGATICVGILTIIFVAGGFSQKDNPTAADDPSPKNSFAHSETPSSMFDFFPEDEEAKEAKKANNNNGLFANIPNNNNENVEKLKWEPNKHKPINIKKGGSRRKSKTKKRRTKRRRSAHHL